ncbi:MAG: hypothetical protein RLY61_200 [Candidatus Parcubacteria bacterium]|jgi:tRNA A37 threonylcarbamoyladenosine biosynthesis protein TsaE
MKKKTEQPSQDMNNFLTELADLMEKYHILYLTGDYGPGTDTHGIHDEHFAIGHESGLRVRSTDFSQSVNAEDIRALRLS